MKIPLVLSLCLISLASSFAQSAPLTSAEKMTKDILLRNGVFYPKHSVIGKSFYGGTWFDGAEDASGPAAFWRLTQDQVSSAMGWGSPEELAKNQGYYVPGTEDLIELRIIRNYKGSN